MENENWKAVPGHEGRYEVSDKGRVRSLDRTVTHSDGFRRKIKGRLLKLPLGVSNGYPLVHLWKDGKQWSQLVHRLVVEAFIGPIPEGYHVDHINNIRDDNRLENLQAISPGDNQRRKALFGTSTACLVKNGTHYQTKKTHCKYGHDLYPENLMPSALKRGKRACLVCARYYGYIHRHNTPEEWHWAVRDYHLEKFLLEKEEV